MTALFCYLLPRDSSAEIEIYYNWYESDQQYIFGGTSTRTPDESEEMKAELVLTDVYLERFGGYEHIPMDGMEDYTVTVDFSSENPGEAHITSVSLDKNGEIVRAGDKVTIKATVDNQEVMDTYGYAYFYSAADIDDNYKSVELTYDEEQKAYIGTFSVEKDTYPCEWYMTDLELHKKSQAKQYSWRISIRISIIHTRGISTYTVEILCIQRAGHKYFFLQTGCQWVLDGRSG